MATFAGTAAQARAPWWWVLITGIAAIILGVLLLTQTAATLVVLVTFIGAYWLVTGIFSLVSLFMNRERWGWKLFLGVIGILAGLTILARPLMSTVLVPAVFAIVIGVQGLLIGIVLVFAAFRGGGIGAAVAGVLSILFSFLLLANPLMAAASLVLVAAWMAIIGGVLTCISAFRHR